MTELSNYLISSEGFEIENPLRLRLLSHLQYYNEEQIRKKLLNSPLSSLSSESSVPRGPKSSLSVSPDQICTAGQTNKQQEHIMVSNVQYTHNTKSMNDYGSPSLQNDLRYFSRSLTPTSHQPTSFAISNYSQNGIKISNYYSLGTDTTMRTSNYWNNSITSLQWHLNILNEFFDFWNLFVARCSFPIASCFGL